MIRTISNLLLIHAICSQGLFAQTANTSLSLAARVERGLQRSDLQSFQDSAKRIPNSSSEVGVAIRAAGKTNDPFWIPYLKPFLQYARSKNSNLSQLANASQMALAKLGNAEQQQQILCEAEFGNASLRYEVVKWKLPYVGGWFSISLLSRWLDENHKAQELVHEPRGDAIHFGPKDLALTTLPSLVPNPPFSAPPALWFETQDQEKLAPQRKAWREWIQDNAESLKKLTPSNDDYEMNPAVCRNILKEDKFLPPR